MSKNIFQLIKQKTNLFSKLSFKNINYTFTRDIQCFSFNTLNINLINSKISNNFSSIDTLPRSIITANIQDEQIEQEFKGRNSKQPKRANHGARPCSSVMRRLKKRAYYRKTSLK